MNQRTRALRPACLVGPAIVVAASFLGIAHQQGTLWPWDRVVHEDGRHSLLATLLYFEHAARELPLDLLLAAAAAGSVRRWAGGPPPGPRTRRRALLLGGLALATVVLVLAGTVAEQGGSALLVNVGQFPTRAGAPLEWGAHWRYHLLERAAGLLATFALAGLLRRGVPEASPSRATLRLPALAFAGLTLVFAPSLEPFCDARFLGHQARELLTHGLVTIPLTIAFVAGLASPGAVRPLEAGERREIQVAAAAAALLALYLAVGALVTGARHAGQSADLRTLLLPHVFEHGLGYLLVPLAGGAFYLIGRGRATRAGD